MTARAITLTDFVASFEAQVAREPDVHPATDATIRELMPAIWAAAERGLAGDVAHGVRMISRKVAQDQQWAAEDRADIEAMGRAPPDPEIAKLIAEHGADALRQYAISKGYGAT